MFGYNKRKFPRANYPCSLTIWSDHANPQVIMGYTANIGAGGLCAHVTQELLVHSALEVRVEFPHQSTPFKCKGKVAHCEHCIDPQGKKFYAVGVEFEPMDELRQAYLQGVVSELIAINEKAKKN